MHKCQLRQRMQLLLFTAFFILPNFLLARSTLSNTQQNSVTEIRLNHKIHEWRLVIETQKPFRYRSFVLSNPDRIVFDFVNTKLLSRVKIPKLIDSPIRRLRYANYSKKLRFVLDLRKKIHTTYFTLKKNHKYGYRLVIILTPVKKKVLAFDWPFTKTKVKAKASKVIKPVIVDEAKKRSRNVIIVIDPGHGGKDPGAIARGGTEEKNIVLLIAKDLQRIFNSQPGFKAVLTRKGDYYLSLRQRLAIARKYKADMFVAIHADAFKNRRAQGASVYALSQRGATSEAARWLATKENASELLGGVDLSDKNNLLKSVLINLSQTATIRNSLQIGQDIINSIRDVARLHHNRVEQAAFVVLKSPDIPSLLVETGFLSNPQEERKLRNYRYRHRIAYAIMRGVKSYFIHHPPRDTWLALEKTYPRAKIKRYKVTSGDTLKTIADKHDVPISKIRKLNRLRNSNIYAGQTLLIPGNDNKDNS